MKLKKQRQLGQFGILYFFSYLIFSFVMTQFTPFLSYLGYDAMERGILLSSYATTTILFQIFFGILSDRYQTIKKILIISLLVFTISAFLLFIQREQILVFHFFLMALSGGLVNTCCGMYDTWMLESNNYLKGKLSFIKAFGSIGWAMGSIVISYIILKFTYYGMAIGLLLLCIIILSNFIFLEDIENKAKQQQAHFGDIRKFLKEKNYCLLIFILFLLYCGVVTNNSTVIDKMLELGATTRQIGIKWSIQSMIEIPTYLLGSYILKRFNYYRLLRVSTLAMMVQFMLLFFCSNIYGIIGLSFFQMFTTPLILITSKMLLYDFSPANLKVSGQLFALSMFTGVSALIVPIAAGTMSKYMGVNQPFLCIVVFCIIAFFLIPLLEKIKVSN